MSQILVIVFTSFPSIAYKSVFFKVKGFFRIFFSFLLQSSLRCNDFDCVNPKMTQHFIQEQQLRQYGSRLYRFAFGVIYTLKSFVLLLSYYNEDYTTSLHTLLTFNFHPLQKKE